MNSDRPVGIIGCGAAKLDRPALARDIYVGGLFRLARTFVEQRCDRWVILSALYGMVEPDATIAPYDVTLNRMNASDRATWARATAAQLDEAFPGATFLTTAGRLYREALPHDRTVCPWDDLQSPKGIGVQLRFLSRETKRPTWHTEWVRGKQPND